MSYIFKLPYHWNRVRACHRFAHRTSTILTVKAADPYDDAVWTDNVDGIFMDVASGGFFFFSRNIRKRTDGVVSRRFLGALAAHVID